MLRIGIDPAFRKDGFTVCILDHEKTVSFKVFKQSRNFFAWINDIPSPSKIAIENSNLDSFMYNKKGSREPMGVYEKRCMSVGKNQAMSQLAVDICQDLGHVVFSIKPSQKGKKPELKWVMRISSAYKFKLLSIPNKEDERDAFKMLLYTL